MKSEMPETRSGELSAPISASAAASGGSGGARSDVAPRALRVSRAQSAKLSERSGPELLLFHYRGATDSAPAPDVLTGFSPPPVPSLGGSGLRTPIAALLAQASTQRKGPREGLLKEARLTLSRLQALVTADEETDRGGLAESIGGPASGHIDVAQLQASLPQMRGPIKLSDTAKLRMQRWIDALQEGIADLGEEAVLLFLADGEPAPAGVELGFATVSAGADPHARACAWASERVERIVSLGRTLRAAELELHHAFDAPRHDAALSGFSADDLNGTEQRALPLAVVLCRASQVPSLLHIHMGVELPISLWVVDDVAQTTSLLERLPLPLMCWARGTAALLLSTTAAGGHLRPGIEWLAGRRGPSLAVVATGEGDSPALAALSRAQPLLAFHPEQPVAAQFSLSENPEWEQRWATSALLAMDPAGLPVEVKQVWTPADLATIDPLLRSDFLPIQGAAWAADQRPVAECLELHARGELGGILPYIWVSDGEGGLQRAIITRRLFARARHTDATYERLRELTGLDNPWFEAGVIRGRSLAGEEHEALLTRLEAEHTEALEQAQVSGAQQAVDRIVSVLLGEGIVPSAGLSASSPAVAERVPTAPDSPPAKVAASPPAAVTSPTPTSAVTAPPPVPPVEEVPEAPTDLDVAEGTAEESEEAFVDSRRCTTCNECTQRFPNVFEYDDNKQARVIDSSTAPFASLVAAAENCPASCIYPGSPRADDPTVTPELRKRAEALG